MFFQRTKEPPYSAVYIDNLMQRMMTAQKIAATSKRSTMSMGMNMATGSELEHLSSLLGNTYKIDNRDGTKRLWINKKVWIQFDPGTEDFRFCDMASGAVTVPFHSTRSQAMAEWVRNYTVAHRDLQPKSALDWSSGKSAFQQLFSSASKTMQIFGILAWALLGVIALSWLLGRVQFF
jgi:hypothetical protein